MAAWEDHFLSDCVIDSINIVSIIASCSINRGRKSFYANDTTVALLCDNSPDKQHLTQLNERGTFVSTQRAKYVYFRHRHRGIFYGYFVTSFLRICSCS